MAGTVSSIFVASVSLGTPESVSEARLVAGSGIVGDRRCRDGAPPDEELTLVESEQIDGFNERTGLDVPYWALRRNLLTRGVRLAELVGARFRVGETEAEGIELCEPCATVGRLLSTDDVPPKRVIRELLHRAGLRARIVASGVIRPGDTVERLGAAEHL